MVRYESLTRVGGFRKTPVLSPRVSWYLRQGESADLMERAQHKPVSRLEGTVPARIINRGGQKPFPRA